jgi:hypothetical protein
MNKLSLLIANLGIIEMILYIKYLVIILSNL